VNALSKEETILGQKVLDKVREVLKRYENYGKYLRFPYEWGERAFRGWLVYEVFHGVLGWPIKYIVFGELFDVLFPVENHRKTVEKLLDLVKNAVTKGGSDDVEKEINSLVQMLQPAGKQ
jgi:hypothetical protein